MTSSTTTTTKIDMETSNLEVECHYLSQALKKLQRRSPEWSYLHQRLATAEEELEAMRQDMREMEMETVQFHYPASPTPMPTPTSGQHEVHDDMFDTAVIDPDLTDVRRPLHEDDNDDIDASCQQFIFCKSSSDETIATTREKIRSHLSLGIKVAMLIAGILLITCNIERHPNSPEAANSNDEDITHSALPVPNIDQWETDFSSLLSNLQPHDGPCASFTLHLVTDQFGNETSWELISVSDSSSGSNDTPIEDKSYLRKRISRVATPPPPSPSPPQTTVVLSGGPYPYQDFDRDASFKDHDSAIVAKACLPIGSYKFVLHDVQRDGICCDYGRGEYGLNLSNGRAIRPLSSGTFLGENEVTSFQVTEDDIDIIPESTDSIKESITSSMPTAETNPATAPDVNPLNSLVTALDMDMITGSGKSYGILFDIETTTSVVIAGMELVLSAISPTYYEIWSKGGSWQDVNVDKPNYFEGFRRVSRGSIDGQGASEFSYIPLHEFHDIEIQGGGRHAFWISLSDDHLAFVNYDDGERSISRHEMQSEVQVSSAELNVMYGAAVRAYSLELADPETDFYYNAGFLGRVWYRTI